MLRLQILPPFRDIPPGVQRCVVEVEEAHTPGMVIARLISPYDGKSVVVEQEINTIELYKFIDDHYDY